MNNIVLEHFLYVLLLPLLAAILPLILNKDKIRDGALVVLAVFFLTRVIALFTEFLKGLLSGKIKLGRDEISIMLFEWNEGLSVSFHLEPLTMLFVLLIAVLWLITTIYTIGYMHANKEENLKRFFCFFNLSIFAVLGIAFAANLLTLFIFYELLTLVTYPLVVHHGNKLAQKSGRLYLAILLGSSLLFFMPAMVITYLNTSSLDFTVGGVMDGVVDKNVAIMILILFLFGLAKTAIFPLYQWLPAAMVAPTPVSALLHAVAVVKAGVFSFIKIITYIFGTEYLTKIVATEELVTLANLPTYIAGFTVIFASIMALRQESLKKMLAYSTVSQLSYIVLAASLYSAKAIEAASFYIVAHAFAKITLFFAAGSFYTMLHKTQIADLVGVAKKMPLTMSAFIIGALSMIGMPLTVGFIGKWQIITAGLASNIAYFVILVLVMSTALNAAYFLPIIIKAFKANNIEQKLKYHLFLKEGYNEAPKPILIAMLLSSFMTILLFFWPGVWLFLVQQVIFLK